MSATGLIHPNQHKPFRLHNRISKEKRLSPVLSQKIDNKIPFRRKRKKAKFPPKKKLKHKLDEERVANETTVAVRNLLKDSNRKSRALRLLIKLCLKPSRLTMMITHVVST